MTLSQHCRNLGWDAAELARRAGINARTARKALDGDPVTARVARAIAQALTEALGRIVTVGNIDGLNVE